jgi:hypothetical protein
MKQMLKSVIMLITSIVLFTAVVYAWFALSNESNIQPINGNVIRRELDMDIQYGINGGGYTNFDEPAEINAFLSSMLPGDYINIKVVVKNSNPIGDADMQLDIIMYNIRAMETDIDYDLTDFFFLDEGTINLTWYESNTEYNLNNSYLVQNILISQINESAIHYLGYDLEPNRMSNLFNHQYVEEELIIENNITILQSSLASQHIVVIEFSIGLDPYTPNDGTGFQNGELLIDGLYTLING